MTTGVLIDGWIQSLYVRSLLDSSAKPIVVGCNDLEISLSEVVVVFSGVLHD